MTRPRPVFPEGKRFAFTIFDDCDNSNIANTAPFYELLLRLGMRTTKTVWAFDSAQVHPNWVGSSTLADKRYAAFARSLQERGVEIASHGASMMSSERARTVRGLEIFQETFGHAPRSYANHGSNRESVYWLQDRVRTTLVRRLYAWRVTRAGLLSEGHHPHSPYFWGDLCAKHVEYVRGFTFPALDLLSVRANIVYRDPSTPFVNQWFSASYAPHAAAFVRLLRPERRRRLVEDGGIAIIATHVAAGFVRDGEVDPEVRRILEGLVEAGGWFTPVSALLDHLRGQGWGGAITPAERRRMELRWSAAAVLRGAGH